MKLLVILFLIAGCANKNIYTLRSPSSSYDGSIESTMTPKKDITQISSNPPEAKVYKLSHARILIADYDLIRRDFPSLDNLSNEQIDNWIIDSVGYISVAQASQQVVNTQIPVEQGEYSAYRPSGYGRALIFDTKDPVSQESIGLIDVKGSGAVNPRQQDHGNGLATLGEAIREFLYERVMREVVKDQRISNKVVGSYAVIDPGFDVVHADGSTSRAGLYLRQAHARNSYEWLPQQMRANVQKIFREYGIDPNENIQGTKTNDIFDFGHYVVRDDTSNIDHAKSLPFHLWGYNKNIPRDPSDRWQYSKQDWPWIWSHELAESFASGDASRDDVWNHFKNLVFPAIEKIRSSRASSPLSCQSAINGL